MIPYREANTLCSKSKLPASDYVINPYIGCTHGCAYCYARFMGRFTGHREPWGAYLEAKRFRSLCIPANAAGKCILIGSVTDAYNPAERSCRLMPDILTALKNCPAHVEILTKSALVTRDIALLRSIPDLAVGISLSNLIEEDNRVFEPGASSGAERLQTLRTLHENGIRTYLFAAPYLPGVTDLPALLAAVKPYVAYACVENLNLRGDARPGFLQRMESRHPDLMPLYRSIYAGKAGPAYWAELEASLPALEKQAGLKIVSYMYHEKLRKRK